MATYSYDEKTNREDLTDIVTNISPTETPLVSMFGKTKANATYHEFVEDELKPAKANAHVEGEDITAHEVPSRVRKGNYTQIIEEDYKVTETQQAVNTAGVKDEYAYNAYKAMKQFSKDLEYALVNNTEAKAGSKTEARQMAGVPGIVKTNILTAASITGKVIGDALQAAWEQGGEPTKLVVSGANKRAVSAMTTSNTKTVAAKDKTLTEAVDVYDTDFGRIEIVASRFMPSDTAFVLDPSYFKVAWLRNVHKADLPKLGDSKAGYIIGECTLEGKAEKASAIIKIGAGK